MNSPEFTDAYSALIGSQRFNEVLAVDNLMDGITANPAEFPYHPKNDDQQFGWTDPVPHRALPGFTVVFRVLDTGDILFIQLLKY